MLSALISLEVTIEDGNNYNTTYVREGKVQVTNLDCYNPNPHCQGSVQEHVLAHTYGEAILGSSCGQYQELADILISRHDYYYYCRRDSGRQEFAYRFSEYNPDDTQKAYPHFTSRIITAASGICTEYHQLESVNATIGDDSAKQFKYTNPTKGNGSIRIPTSFLGDAGTTYIYRGFNTPDKATDWACGDRCLLMWVYKNKEADEGPIFYECPITISEVSNSGQPEHNISNFVASLAAASIALQGTTHKPFADLDWEQFQFYASGWVENFQCHFLQLNTIPRSLWDVHHHDAETAGANIAEFAIGSLATLVSRNPPININGMVPYLGSRLSISPVAFGALLACIVVVHGVVFGLTYWLSRK